MAGIWKPDRDHADALAAGRYAEAPAANSLICPVCTALPGAMPVVNRKAVEQAILVGLALNCRINPLNQFARKNYFYPDLPKGYQITQYDQAIGQGGWFDVPMPDGQVRHVSLTKMHIEEDAGKTKNDAARGARLIDMNRCGVPLVEMVTNPDLRSADEAAQFLICLRQLLRWIDVSDANMERAHIRCDANVSIREAGETRLNSKTEIKNVNSIEAVRDAIEKEVERQIKEVSAGRRVQAWTLEWDEDSQTLKKMRSKETEADYRYFREPDLLSLRVDPAWRAEILARLPELPLERRARFMEEYKLPAYDAAILTEERSLSDYFETAVRLRGAEGDPKTLANWVQNEILRRLNEQGLTAAQLPFTSAHLAELAQLVESKTITRQTGAGLIGKVESIDFYTNRPIWPQGIKRPTEAHNVPPTLDWELWLGPAAFRPYHPGYAPFNWRGWWDFGTGALGDIGCHAMDPVFRALKLGAPLSVQAASTRVNEESYPLSSMVTYGFPARPAAPQAINCHVKGLSGTAAGAVAMPPCKLVWYDGGLRPPLFKELECDGVEMPSEGVLYVGDRGKILAEFTGGNPRLIPAARMRDFQAPPKTLPRPIGELEQWIRACQRSENAEWASFASGIQSDGAAVKAALRWPWNNGQLEGQINRLKLIKRQMYGRAKFDLLRARVLSET